MQVIAFTLSQTELITSAYSGRHNLQNNIEISRLRS